MTLWNAILLWTTAVTSLLSIVSSRPYAARGQPTYLNYEDLINFWSPTENPLGAYVPSTASLENSASTKDELVEISIKAANLPNYGGNTCATYMRSSLDQNEWNLIHTTQPFIGNTDVEFKERPLLPYSFNEKQMIAFQIVDSNRTTMESAECSLGELITRGIVTLPLRHQQIGQAASQASIAVTVERFINNRDEVRMTLTGDIIASEDRPKPTNPFMEIYVQRDRSYELVYKTEVLLDTLEPTWSMVVVSTRKLCDGDQERFLKFICWNLDMDGRRKLLGEFQTTMAEMRRKNEATFLLKNEKGHIRGQVHIVDFQYYKFPTFGEFIRGGLQIHSTIGIDFSAPITGSGVGSSFHYHDPTGAYINNYEETIKSVVGIIEDYKWDKRFNVFGFGGRYRQNSSLTFFQDFTIHPPNGCVGVQGILNAYRAYLPTVQSLQPTALAPYIQNFIQGVRAANSQDRYHILFLLTNGVIPDIAETRNALDQASHLPVSILVVGFGDNASVLENLMRFKTDAVRRGEYNAETSRDVLQFAPFSKFVSWQQSTAGSNRINGTSLAKELLANVPDQLVSFMWSNGYTPQPPDFDHALFLNHSHMPSAYGFQPPYGTSNYASSAAVNPQFNQPHGSHYFPPQQWPQQTSYPYPSASPPVPGNTHSSSWHPGQQNIMMPPQQGNADLYSRPPSYPSLPMFDKSQHGFGHSPAASSQTDPQYFNPSQFYKPIPPSNSAESAGTSYLATNPDPKVMSPISSGSFTNVESAANAFSALSLPSAPQPHSDHEPPAPFRAANPQMPSFWDQNILPESQVPHASNFQPPIHSSDFNPHHPSASTNVPEVAPPPPPSHPFAQFSSSHPSAPCETHLTDVASIQSPRPSFGNPIQDITSAASPSSSTSYIHPDYNAWSAAPSSLPTTVHSLENFAAIQSSPVPAEFASPKSSGSTPPLQSPSIFTRAEASAGAHYIPLSKSSFPPATGEFTHSPYPLYQTPQVSSTPPNAGDERLSNTSPASPSFISSESAHHYSRDRIPQAVTPTDSAKPSSESSQLFPKSSLLFSESLELFSKSSNPFSTPTVVESTNTSSSPPTLVGLGSAPPAQSPPIFNSGQSSHIHNRDATSIPSSGSLFENMTTHPATDSEDAEVRYISSTSSPPPEIMQFPFPDISVPSTKEHESTLNWYIDPDLERESRPMFSYNFSDTSNPFSIPTSTKFEDASRPTTTSAADAGSIPPSQSSSTVVTGKESPSVSVHDSSPRESSSLTRMGAETTDAKRAEPNLSRQSSTSIEPSRIPDNISVSFPSTPFTRSYPSHNLSRAPDPEDETPIESPKSYSEFLQRSSESSKRTNISSPIATTEFNYTSDTATTFLNAGPVPPSHQSSSVVTEGVSSRISPRYSRSVQSSESLFTHTEEELRRPSYSTYNSTDSRQAEQNVPAQSSTASHRNVGSISTPSSLPPPSFDESDSTRNYFRAASPEDRDAIESPKSFSEFLQRSSESSKLHSDVNAMESKHTSASAASSNPPSLSSSERTDGEEVPPHYFRSTNSDDTTSARVSNTLPIQTNPESTQSRNPTTGYTEDDDTNLWSRLSSNSATDNADKH